jgi:hypothetical protein
MMRYDLILFLLSNDVISTTEVILNRRRRENELAICLESLRELMNIVRIAGALDEIRIKYLSNIIRI